MNPSIVSLFADTQLFSHVRHFERSKRRPLLAVVLCAFAQMGCSMFSAPVSSTSVSSKHPILPPIQTSPDAILVKLAFLERPAEDRLLASEIWKDVDQIGALPSETREHLIDNGFRLGHVSSNPPLSVQKLLGMVTEFPAGSSEFARPLMGRHQFLPPGLETEIPTGIEHEKCDFIIRDGNRTKTLEFEHVNCVLRMNAQRLQEGWVRVDFQPEIHYGDNEMRRVPTKDGWALRAGQNIDVRHSQRFSVTLNVGEFALMTSTSGSEGSLGDRFFCHEDRGQKKQRVLIVQIVDAGQPSTTFAK